MLFRPAELDGKNRNHAPESCRENGSGVIDIFPWPPGLYKPNPSWPSAYILTTIIAASSEAKHKPSKPNRCSA